MMISLLQATYCEGGKFSVSFSNECEGVFDLNQYLATRHGPLLAPLQDDSYVRRAFVEAGALAWPNGLELAPERIYQLANILKRAVGSDHENPSTGKNGQVGFELQRALAPLGEIHTVDVADCNLADEPAIRQLVQSFRPQAS